MSASARRRSSAYTSGASWLAASASPALAAARISVMSSPDVAIDAMMAVRGGARYLPPRRISMAVRWITALGLALAGCGDDPAPKQCDVTGHACTWAGIPGEFGFTP